MGRFKTIILWAISLLFLFYTLWGIDFFAVITAMRSYYPAPAWLVGFFLLMFYLSNALRLYLLLPGEKKAQTAIKAIFIGMGYNNIMPAKAGEILKIMYLSRNLNMPLADSGATVFCERIFDILFLFALSLVLAYFGFESIPLYIPFILIFLLAVGFFLVRRYSDFFHACYKKIPSIRFGKFMDMLHYRLIDAVTLRWFSRGIGITCLVWLVSLSCYITALLFVAELRITVFQAVVVFVAASFGSAIPSSPGALGVFEASIVYSLSLFGVGREEAFGAALFLRIILFLPVTVAGLVFFIMSREKTTS